MVSARTKPPLGGGGGGGGVIKERNRKRREEERRGIDLGGWGSEGRVIEGGWVVEAERNET